MEGGVWSWSDEMPVWSVAAAIIVVLAIAYLRRRRLRRRVRPAPAPAPRIAAAPPPVRLIERSRVLALSEVNDPVTAAATLVHVVTGPEGWPRIRQTVLAELAAVTSRERAGDAIMFAEWAVRQGLDEHHAIDVLAETLCRQLGKNELSLVIALLEAGASAGGPEAEPYADHAKSQIVLTTS